MTATLLAYHGLLWLGLGTMLLNGWGWIAFLVYNGMMPLGALGIWIVYRHRLPVPNPAPYPGALRQMTWGIALAAAIPLAIFGAMLAAGWASDITHDAGFRSLITAILVPQLFVAAIEELSFRGVTQPLLSARFNPRVGLAATALLFGVFHVPNALYQGVHPSLLPLTIGTLTLMGWVFGEAYRRTGQRLVLPFALHYGWNIASFSIEDVLYYDATGPRWITGTPDWFPESGILGAAGLALLGIAIMRLLGTRSTTYTETIDRH